MYPSKALVTNLCGSLQSHRGLTQFRLDCDSSKVNAGLADPYLCQNTDLCPCFQPVPFSLNNGELSFPAVWCSANRPFSHPPSVTLCCSLPRVCMFPRCLISHFLVQASHMPVRCVSVSVSVCLCWVLVSRPVRM